jgi:hypothetical protein
MNMPLIPTFIAVGIIETLLWLTWNPVYFRTGIPLFVVSARVPKRSELPTARVMEASTPDDGYSSLLFRDLGANTYAFREKVFDKGKKSYGPVVRGLLKFEVPTGKLSVKGYVNWYTLYFCYLTVRLPLEWYGLQLMAFFPMLLVALLIGSIYRTQKRRFATIGKVAERLWGESGDPEAAFPY